MASIKSLATGAQSHQEGCARRMAMSDRGKCLVVYESMFGNTQAIAEAVAQGLAKSSDVAVAEASEAPSHLADDVALLVVGGPTHAFSMSRPRTRQSAAEQGADPARATHRGIREWIAEVSPRADLPFATFDTKVVSPHLPGSAARAADRKLKHRRFRQVAPPETFYVTGTTGGLVDGELKRAAEWGESLHPSV
jgi:hypothetical protein